MSIVITRALFCDRCANWYDGGDPFALAPDIRRDAVKHGWKRRQGKDVCPEHDEPAAPQPTEEFHEDDEPVADVLAAFNGGPHFVTAPSTEASPSDLQVAPTLGANDAGLAAREDTAPPDGHQVEVREVKRIAGWWAATCWTPGCDQADSGTEQEANDWADQHRADTLRPSGPFAPIRPSAPAVDGDTRTAPANPTPEEKQ